MKKKILIIESDRSALCAMVRIARAAGHEVMGIFLGEHPPVDEGLSATDNPEQVISWASSFNPDIALLEHDFRLGAHLAGAYFVNRLGLRRDILVGTSIVHEQSYCGRKMQGKLHLSEGAMRNHFLSVIAA